MTGFPNTTVAVQPATALVLSSVSRLLPATIWQNLIFLALKVRHFFEIIIKNTVIFGLAQPKYKDIIYKDKF